MKLEMRAAFTMHGHGQNMAEMQFSVPVGQTVSLEQYNTVFLEKRGFSNLAPTKVLMAI